jgi:hypothetical protein
MSNLDISTSEVYMARKHSPLIPKERFRPVQAAAAVLNQNCLCAEFLQESKVTGNLNLLKFNSKSLDVRGLIGVKACI